MVVTRMRHNVAHLLAINLNHPGRYVHWGVVQISVANVGPYPRFLDTGVDYAAVGSVAL
jgi:hypothetical protein